MGVHDSRIHSRFCGCCSYGRLDCHVLHLGLLHAGRTGRRPRVQFTACHRCTDVPSPGTAVIAARQGNAQAAGDAFRASRQRSSPCTIIAYLMCKHIAVCAAAERLLLISTSDMAWHELQNYWWYGDNARHQACLCNLAKCQSVTLIRRQ